MADGIGRVAGAAMLFLLGGCGCGSDGGPYIVSPTGPALEGARGFAIRYSDWRNTRDEVIALIADQCGTGFTTARLFLRPYEGTVLHPQLANVACGDPGVPPPAYPGQQVDPGLLVQWRWGEG